MKKIILNCSWNPGSYSFVCDFDENSAHYEVKRYRPGNSDNKVGDLTGKELKTFLKKVNSIDYMLVNNELGLPDDGGFLDFFTMEFLYTDDNRFYTCRWQPGFETEEMERIEELITYCDIDFRDLYTPIDD